MKIESFDLDLSSTRTYTESYSSEFTRELSFVDLMDTRLGETDNRTRQITESHSISSDDSGAQEVSFNVSRRFERTSEWFYSVSVEDQELVSLSDRFLFELEKMRQIASKLMEALESMMVDGCQCYLDKFNQVYAMSLERTDTSQYLSWNYSQTHTETYEESESTHVFADGIVRTADNREIDFNFQFQMDRTFLREDAFTWTESGVALIDPLIIRTDMTAPLLSGTEFSFDLDLDGDLEDMPAPGPGMGFLALDLNEDGIINDGSELFGPSTGSGFGELAEYDLDGNNWIDENDAVFDQLTLWQSAESGGMTLTRLQDAGIGAIYLAGVESSFDLTDNENDTWARISKTSVALTENGDVLPVQELNYNV